MDNQYQVYSSNRVESLYERMRDALFVGSSPFARRLVVVPSPAMKSWLMVRMAEDPQLEIAAGLEVTYLNQSISRLGQLVGTEHQHQPGQLELALAIEAKIREVVASGEGGVWRPLLDYLERAPIDSRKGRRRLVALSEKLAHLFSQYGIYGGKMLEEWGDEWQGALWHALYDEKLAWSYPYRALSAFPAEKLQKEGLSLHLFALSHLSELHHTLMLRVSQQIPVNCYHLSPCQEFWSDLRSDREVYGLQKRWQRELVREEQQEAMEAYLRDRNGLLANLGRLGRQMTLLFEESDLDVEQTAVLPSGVQEVSQYAPHLVPEQEFYASEGLSLLQAVQADMLLLRNAGEGEKIALRDDSIQCHVAASRMREVEILHDNLLRLLARHAGDEESITPGDVLVMAPDIMDYEPYIRAVFGVREGILNFQMMDLKIPSESPLIQGYLELLGLVEGRWDILSVEELFNNRFFQEKHGLSPADVRKIQEWITLMGIRWGMDAEHRQEILTRDHGEKQLLDDSSAATWDHGFSRLLMGLAMDEEGESSVLPADSVDTTQAPLLGKWIRLLRELRRDLKPLIDDVEMMLVEWSEMLRELYESYFLADANSEQQLLLSCLESFGRASGFLSEKRYSYTSIKHHLLNMLEKQQISYRESDLQAVRFCSMLPMRALPSKVIVLLGMEEGAFPRQARPFSLDLMMEHPSADTVPTQTDYDRFLFLEVLLSARKYLIMSYTGQSSADGKEQPPSLLLTELMGYIEQGYEVENPLVTEHPFHGFDAVCFEENNPYRSYSKKRYREALAHYGMEKVEPHRFIEAFSIGEAMPAEAETLCLDLSQLNLLARNPLEVYFRGNLGIYINSLDIGKAAVDETFDLEPLMRAVLRNRCIKEPLEQTMERAEREGILPLGGFREWSLNRLSEEVGEVQRHLSELGVESIHAIELSERCQQPIQHDSGDWELPPIQFDLEGQKIVLTGRLEDVSTCGLLSHAKGSPVDALKAWPRYLVFRHLVKEHTLPHHDQLIFSRSGLCKEVGEGSLDEYVEYYLKSLKNPSPMLPEWVPELMKHDSQVFTQKISAALRSPHVPFYHQNILWMAREGLLPNFEQSKQWKEQAQVLFTGMLDSWYPKWRGR